MATYRACVFSDRMIARFRRVQGLLNQLDDGEHGACIVPGSPYPQGDILVFPGSFNPPTSAHLAMLKQARDVVRSQSPMLLYAAFSNFTVDKGQVERPLLLDRILLLDQLLQHRLRGSGIIVFHRGLYVEEAEALRRSFTRVRRIFFLLGYDKIVQIFDARYYVDRDSALARLFRQADVFVAPRGDGGEREVADLLRRPENKRFADHVHPLPLDQRYRTLSSSQVRQGAAELTRAVPQEVRTFMRTTRAYEMPVALGRGMVRDDYSERAHCIETLLRAGSRGGRVSTSGVRPMASPKG